MGFHVLVLLMLLTFRVHQESATDTLLFSALDELPPDVNFDSATLDHPGDSLDIGSYAATAGAGVAARSVETIQQEVREQIEQEFKAPEAPSIDEASPVAFDALSGTVETTGGSVENLAHSGGVAGAIDRLAFEIVQSLHEQPTTVIWLFDRSQSLKERRDAIADRFENVYRELASLEEGSNGSLTTVVATYGDQFALLNDRPTDDFKSLIPKVRKIEDDPSGRENVFAAVSTLATKFRSERAKGRNVMIFIITDERGDDAPKHLEETILLCRRAGIRVYVVGNSSPFGREKGFVKWTYPDGFVEDVPVDAGPESVEPETLALGFWGNRGPDLRRMSSGYGPYGLTRLCKETKGLYYIAQEDRHGPTFSPAVMRNYAPDYRPIREYTVSLERNHAKAALVMASKHSAQAAQQKSLDDLRTPRLRFQAYNDTILREEATEAQKPAAELQYQIERLVGILGGGEKDRAKLVEPRWRAAFDLAAGRALAMKVRLLAYNQMLADMKGTPRAFKKSDSNEWRLIPAKSSDAGQAVKKLEKQATTYLERVVDEHPGTPWAEIAQIELSTPLGWEWQEARNPASFPPKTSPDEARRRILLAEDEARKKKTTRPKPAPQRERPRL